ncbi:Superfamily II DNA and RNA helicase [Streptomyces sp. 3213]|uniref:DEAD/DEAH box helicase n=1 Tax=Streptomyces sp. 3213.3 TaxID=1855348 RepID=UPI000896AB33|nr:DEAD/DEAH box helicase [Streptomyces sp. 3213.3]SEE43838.1 Superfamily II DNA and RNA helicase [Streptomyces sp. 3213] [Streptomyces sp. 3213.3]
MTLPVALSGTDVIGQAKTGTGKTLGFGLPLLERVTVPADVEAGRAKPEQLTDAPQALVVVPTRELCTQVTNDLLTAGKVRNVRVLAIYGGRAYEPQVEALRKGVDVVVGTPGRLLDLAGQKKLDLKHIRSLVLDEADEMLDLGFLPDVEKIINFLPAKRQTMLFSATMPGAVIGLARRYMTQPTHIRATSPDDEGKTVANTTQFVYRAHNMDKPELVARILQAEGRGLVMVFCRTKRTAADLADQLQQRGFASGAVHGDLGQGAREQALRAFRNGKVDVLVCTDVAARGIDVEGVTHVINYQSPEDEKTYLHRIGRTGRAGAKGIAVTLVDWDDIPRWQLINKALDLKFNDPPETYSTSPHFFEELNIPAGTKGVLPRSERTRAGLAAEEVEDLGETGGRGGPRGRGGRDGGRGGRDSGRGGRDAGRDNRSESRSAAGPVDAERPARTPRRRRRTRNGAPMEGTSAATAVTSTPEETALAASEETATRTPRRRRRTRTGATGEQLPATAVTSAVAPEAAENAVATAESPALDTPAPARRRRTRKSAEPAVVTAETVVAETPVAEAPVAEETKPRRRTRKAVAAAEPVEAVAVTEAAAVAAVDTAEAVEAKPRRTRTRKTAAPAEVVAVDTAEGTEAKPRRRAATRKAVADIPAQVAEESEVKPRRTARKAAEAPVEAEAKPRRTRKAAVATEAAEAVVETVEAVETKPRRTRKVAAAPVATEATETTEVKPRRTRKTAVAAEAVLDTVEAVEAKPRRTRKAAAAPVAAEVVEAAEVAPRRTRKVAAAPVATETPDTVETKPRSTRTRKTAAVAADTVAEDAEAKPRRRVATHKAVADIPAQVAEESEAKPRRRTTRKAAEAPVVAETEAAEAKPRVRRPRKAAAAEVGES